MKLTIPMTDLRILLDCAFIPADISMRFEHEVKESLRETLDLDDEIEIDLDENAVDIKWNETIVPEDYAIYDQVDDILDPIVAGYSAILDEIESEITSEEMEIVCQLNQHGGFSQGEALDIVKVGDYVAFYGKTKEEVVNCYLRREGIIHKHIVVDVDASFESLACESIRYEDQHGNIVLLSA